MTVKGSIVAEHEASAHQLLGGTVSVRITKDQVLEYVWDEAPAWVARMVEKALAEEFERGWQEGRGALAREVSHGDDNIR